MNGRFATFDPTKPRTTAVEINNGVFETHSGEDQVMRLADADTTVSDLEESAVYPM